MEFLVHIGVNKTGTSSLQRAFFERRAALSEQGILYPQTGLQHSAHHQLSRVLKGAAPETLGMAADWAERLRAEYGDHDLCVLSSENFATMRNIRPMTAIAPPGRTRVVVYLRDYARYMVSWYQQAIHSRNIAMSLEDFLDSHKPEFATILGLWRETYGEQNVTVRLYDRDSLKDQDIVADFCDLIRPGLEETFSGMTHNSNPSLSGNLLFFKRLLNMVITGPESMQIASEMVGLALLDPTFRGKLAVNAEALARIRFLTREDAARIREMTGLDLVSRQRAIEGHASPDLDRLAADLEKISDFAAGRGFRLHELLARLRGLSPLALAGQEASAGQDLS